MINIHESAPDIFYLNKIDIFDDIDDDDEPAGYDYYDRFFDGSGLFTDPRHDPDSEPPPTIPVRSAAPAPAPSPAPAPAPEADPGYITGQSVATSHKDSDEAELSSEPD